MCLSGGSPALIVSVLSWLWRQNDVAYSTGMFVVLCEVLVWGFGGAGSRAARNMALQCNHLVQGVLPAILLPAWLLESRCRGWWDQLSLCSESSVPPTNPSHCPPTPHSDICQRTLGSSLLNPRCPTQQTSSVLGPLVPAFS